MKQMALGANYSPTRSSAELSAQNVCPISRRQLHDELLTGLRDFIIAGQLATDAKVPEKDLCEFFGVSRTPLREALKVLAYEGLVTLNHNRGAVVRPLTMDDLNEAFPIYAQLEALAGELACQHLSQSEIDDLRRLHDEMIAAYNSDDIRSFVEANEQMHARIQAASRNRNLLRLIRCVSSRVRRARLSVKLPKARLSSAIQEHERIMDALERRDAVQLSQAIRNHIECTLRFFRDAWTAEQSAPTKLAVRAGLGGTARPA